VLGRQSDRLARLVQDLLEVSRLEVDSLALRRQPIDLVALVADVMERMTGMADGHRLALTAAEPALVVGDADRIEQVLVNLLSNAIKFSPGGGEIEARVVIVGAEAVVSVRDEGVGIPAERQGQIFERFYRAHADTEHDYGGMGIGLYYSRELIARHGGRMWFESERGRGATFSFSLPLSQGGRDGARGRADGVGGRG
jgi:signal transduction histidine kinase